MNPSNLSKFLNVAIRSKLPILIKGAPGVGKTDIVSQACTSAGAHLMISHPVVSDPTDYKGMPFVLDGEAKFLPFGDLKALCDAKEPTVFFLDDLGQSPASVQASCMQLILSRRINGHMVSPHVTFMAATNRRADKAGVTSILEPVKSRFVSIVELEPDMNDWIVWALQHNIPQVLIAFIRFRPNLLFNFTPTPDITNSSCPRTVANVGRLLLMNLPSNIEFEAISGAAGEAFATELQGFLQIYRSIPNIDLVLTCPDQVQVPSSHDVGTIFALCGAIASKMSDQNFDNIVKYAVRLPAEFQMMLIQDCKAKYPDVVNTTAYITWACQNQL